MSAFQKMSACAAFCGLLGAASAAFAAGFVDPPAEPASPPSSLTIVQDHQFDTEIVVRDWVLCVSRPLAEQLVHAWEEGVEAGAAKLADLRTSRACGRFPELRVVLQEAVYFSRAGQDATVFHGLVSVGGGWAAGYLVQDERPGN